MRIRSLFFSVTMLLPLLFIIGCSDVDKSITALQDALKKLDDMSIGWQQTLNELETKLASDAQKTLRDEVTTLAQRTGQSLQVSAMCTVDFARARIKLELSNMLEKLQVQGFWAKIQGKKPNIQIIPPYVCEVSPTHVDLRRESDSRNTIDITGFDMDPKDTSPLRMVLIDGITGEEDVTKWLAPFAHYRWTVNIAPNGLQFKPTSQRLVVRWGKDDLGSIWILADKTPFRPVVFSDTSGVAPHPSMSVAVSAGYKLIGGGCRSLWSGHGQLLIDSYPDGNKWRCRAKDHGTPDPASLRVFAIGIPSNLDIDIKITSQKGGAGTAAHPDHSEARATAPAGYIVVGGGCQDSWSEGKPGHYLVKSMPVDGGWYCYGKDHNGADDKEVVTAYVISVKARSFDVVSGASKISNKEAHPASSSAIGDKLAGIVGGGCDVSYGSPGNIIWASNPNDSTNAWDCASKDHEQPDPETVTAYSFGLKRK